MAHASNASDYVPTRHAPVDAFSVRADTEESFQRALDLLGPVAIGRAIGHAHSTITRDRVDQAQRRGVALLHVYDRAEQDQIARAAAAAGHPELQQTFQRQLGAPPSLIASHCTIESALRAEQRADAALSLAIGEALDDKHGKADPVEAARLIPQVEARMSRDRNIVMPLLRTTARLGMKARHA